MNGPANAAIHALSGAYVLGALPADEQAAFERHLAGCEPCRQEVRELRETAARLGTSAAVVPPADLRGRVLGQAQRTRQLPPVADRRSMVSGLPWQSRAVLGLAAALLVAVMVLTGATVHLTRELDRERSRSDAVAAVLAAPDARTVTGKAETSGSGTVVVSRRSGRAVFLASALSSLPEQRTYQLWFIGSGGARSAGLVNPGADGRVAPRVLSGLGDAGQIGMTVEPAGGSARPTTTPVLLFDVSR